VRIVYFGSGAFGLPTLESLTTRHEVELVVCQPPRPAGRRRTLTPTPVEAYARDHGLDVYTPTAPNGSEAIEHLRAVDAQAWVVIAYGHKLSPDLLGDTFAINLHASLLPKYRGAAPINHAMIDGEATTGVSVIALAQRMDAGAVYHQATLRIDPVETAGELHDRLALLGPDAINTVLEQFERDELKPVEQDHRAACPAPKFSKSDGTTTFDEPADVVRARIHGLTPWPGCTVLVDGEPLKLCRARVVQDDDSTIGPAEPGTIMPDGTIACGSGRLEPLAVQPAGGTLMSFTAYRNGRRLPSGLVIQPRIAPETHA